METATYPKNRKDTYDQIKNPEEGTFHQIKPEEDFQSISPRIEKVMEETFIHLSLGQIFLSCCHCLL